jgi:hypothetical protein
MKVNDNTTWSTQDGKCLNSFSDQEESSDDLLEHYPEGRFTSEMDCITLPSDT